MLPVPKPAELKDTGSVVPRGSQNGAVKMLGLTLRADDYWAGSALAI
jgi:hypothetical protein